MQKPIIKSVDIKKTGRFWSVSTDKHKPVAVVLYKRGALAVQELLQQLAGIAPAESPKSTKTAKPSKAAKKPRAKTPTKKAAPEKAAPSVAEAVDAAVTAAVAENVPPA
ncbi:MAG: hypothetical protein HZA90_14830 [Verrucomicrobia bacterium]|nr:hypothetical protein [Verrucomicrobiota bacterium]